MTPLLPLSQSLNKRKIQNNNEIRVDPLGLLRADTIFADMSRESDNNLSTIAKKGREMARSAAANKTINLTADSNTLAKIGIKVIA